MRRLGPALLTALLLTLYLALALAQNQGDLGEMARLGLRRMAGDQQALEGYDGQYVYVLALNPDPAWAAAQPPWIIDTPAYRYQRLLLSLAARALSLGQPALLPWALIVLNLLAQAAGAFLVGELLASYGVSRWYALVYGLWVGFIYAVRLAMTEPLAYALAAGALLASRRGRERWAAGLYALALFAKETTLLFLAAHLAWLASNARWREALWLSAVAVIPFALFQLVILAYFGRFGLGSGGFHASGFEWLPFMGLWRIGAYGWAALALYGTLFLPLVVLPSLWGIAAAGLRLARRDWALPVWVLGANAALFPFAPFSTYSEPLGLVRLMCGLVPAVLLFGAHTGWRRALNYSVFWLAALAMLANETR